MSKKRIEYDGIIEELKFRKIYINVNHLKKGKYEIHITYKNKIIKTIYLTFNQ